MSNKTTYWPKRNYYQLIMLIIAIPILFLKLKDLANSSYILALIVVGVTTLLYFGKVGIFTRYVVKDTFLKGGGFKIDILKVSEIEIKHKSVHSIFNWISGHGYLIKYDKYDEAFVSPKKDKEFLQHLKNINPQIEVITNDSAEGAKPLAQTTNR